MTDLASMFNDAEGNLSTAKLGTTALTTGIGGYIGNTMGGTLGTVLGGLGGLLGGTFLSQLFGAGSPKNEPFKAPFKPGVVQAGAIRTDTGTVANQTYTYDAPNLPGLVRPWRNNGDNVAKLDEFCEQMETDTKRLMNHATKPIENYELLKQTLMERRKKFYDYIRTTQKYHDDLEKYNAVDRVKWLKDLGLDESTELGRRLAPPKYTIKLDIQIPEELETEARLNLKVPDAQWNAMGAADRLQRIEESIISQWSENDTKFKAVFTKGEKDDDGTPQFSLNRLLDRVSFNPSTTDRLDKAFKEFKGDEDVKAYEKVDKSTPDKARAAYVKCFGDGDETKLRNALEAIAKTESTYGEGGKKNAEFLRALCPPLMEQIIIVRKWNEVQRAKHGWATKAENWFNSVDELDKARTAYAAAHKAGAHKQYRVVEEITMHLPASDPVAQQEAGVHRAVIDRSIAATTKFLNIMKIQTTKLDVKSTVGYTKINIEKELNTLPTTSELMGSTDKGNHDIVHKHLVEYAENYNKRLEEYRKDRMDSSKEFLLESAAEDYKKELASYVHYVKTLTDENDRYIREKEKDIATRTTQGTKEAGREAFALTVTDVSPQATANIQLFGIKKDGKYFVTGYSRLPKNGGPAEERKYITHGPRDIANAMEITPANPTQLDAIMQRINDPAAKPLKPLPPQERYSFSAISQNLNYNPKVDFLSKDPNTRIKAMRDRIVVRDAMDTSGREIVVHGLYNENDMGTGKRIFHGYVIEVRSKGLPADKQGTLHSVKGHPGLVRGEAYLDLNDITTIEHFFDEPLKDSLAPESSTKAALPDSVRDQVASMNLPALFQNISGTTPLPAANLNRSTSAMVA